MTQGKIQAVFIDWHLTLSASVFWEHLAAENIGLYSTLNHSLFSVLAPQIVPWMRGARTSEQMMLMVAQSAGLSYDTVYAEFVRSGQTMKFIAPEVPVLVAELRRRGVRVIVATDNMDAFTRFTAPAMGLSTMFDDVLNSSDLRALKDDFDAGGKNLFFHDYLLVNGLSADRCVLIDDSTDTRETAARIGMRYLWVTAENGLLYHLRALLQETAAF